MVPAAAPAYLLSRHAHVCVTGDTLIMLDEMTGKYLSINRQAAAVLGSHIRGWPMVPEDGGPPPVLQSLIERSLITKDPRLGKAATPATVQLPTTWLQDHQPRGCPRITVSDFGRFSISVAYALYSKRFLPFRHTVSRVQQSRRAAPTRQVDMGQLSALVRVFDWLRPLGFGKANECFLYCLALNEFLSRYSIHPSWIFAVRARPFAAHCWLQYGDRALTDIPFNLRRMVPILVL